ncbi:MAG: hypothetical protein WC506_03020 [Candidatus Micrarchaeia archaeon]
MPGFGTKSKKERPEGFQSAIPETEKIPSGQLNLKVVRAEDEARLKAVAEQLLAKINKSEYGTQVEITLDGRKFVPKK